MPSSDGSWRGSGWGGGMPNRFDETLYASTPQRRVVVPLPDWMWEWVDWDAARLNVSRAEAMRIALKYRIDMIMAPICRNEEGSDA